MLSFVWANKKNNPNNATMGVKNQHGMRALRSMRKRQVSK